MVKTIIMETEFRAIPMGDIPLSEYLETDTGYVDVGGFEIKKEPYTDPIPFDFEATVFDIRGNDTYGFGNWDGLLQILMKQLYVSREITIDMIILFQLKTSKQSATH